MKRISIRGTAADRVIPFVLEGVRYDLRLRWSAAAEAWYAELWRDGALLAPSCRLIPNWPLWRRWFSDAMPGGRFLPYDSADDSASALGRHDINERIALMYVVPEDLGEPIVDELAIVVASVEVTEPA